MNNTCKRLLPLLLLLLCANCATSLPLKSLRLGMTTAEVTETLGKPDHYRAAVKRDDGSVALAWEYEVTQVSGRRVARCIFGLGLPFLWGAHLEDGQPVFVILVDDELRMWGERGNVRLELLDR